MTLSKILYNLFIGPFELLFDMVYGFAYQLVESPGPAIIFLSLAVNLLVLPLYKQSDRLQAEQIATQKKMQPWIKHINRTFSGDERYMMLQTYYRQNNYRPLDSLKGLTTLLLEIPSFMAAYHFLSELEILKGASFGPVSDLAKPDRLLAVGGLSLNLLPILMTLFNLLSSYVYAKEMPRKNQLVLLASALVFLVLLYDSPSGLVFYWTLNNVFSLVKNLFYRLKEPKKVFHQLLALGSAALLLYGLVINPIGGLGARLVLISLSIVSLLPYIQDVYHKKRPARELDHSDPQPEERKIFQLGALFLCLFLGLMIPTTVMQSSPEEFVDSFNQASPLNYSLYVGSLSAGFFLVWLTISYHMSSNRFKRNLSQGLWVISGIALLDYFGFGNDFGSLSAQLVYDQVPYFPPSVYIINGFLAGGAAFLCHQLWKRRREWIPYVYRILLLAVLGISIFNISRIQPKARQAASLSQQGQEEKIEIPLSRKGKNVMVIMMDRAIGSFPPYLFHERPELKKQFAGFTYYPNTISYGGHTNFGSPALFGGYEYRPEQMNEREELPLAEKQNEALKLMPFLFDEAGYAVRVADPPYAGYSYSSDLSIYDSHPNIQAFHAAQLPQIYSDPKYLTSRIHKYSKQVVGRNLFAFSIMRISPVVFQPFLYDGGNYNSSLSLGSGLEGAAKGQVSISLTEARGVDPDFVQNYDELRCLADISRFHDGDQGCFVMMDNNTTHASALLQEPDYHLAGEVDNRPYEKHDPPRRTDGEGHEYEFKKAFQNRHYHVNMAGMQALGDWFDLMRKEGVYDNTRIIIVADHGYSMGLMPSLILDTAEKFENHYDTMFYNPLLMVKDFNSQTFRTDRQFMTNADVPTLAMEGVIDHPVNPFTGQAVTNEAKKEGPQKILASNQYQISSNNGNQFKKGPWLTVHDNIFDRNNWKVYGSYEQIPKH